MKGRISGLRARLIALVLLAVLPAVALILYNGHRHVERAKEQTLHEAQQLVAVAVADHTRLLADTRQLLLTLARLPEVRGDALACGDFLAKLKSGYPHYANLAVVSPAGRVVCSAYPLSRPVDASGHAWFRRATQTRQAAVGDYQMGCVVGRPVLVTAHPDYDHDGRLRTVLTASLDLQWLHRLLTKAPLVEGTSIMLLDSRGTVLSRHPEALQQPGSSHADTPLGHVVLAQKQGTLEAADLDGVPRLYAFAPLATVGAADAYVVVGVPRDRVLAEARRARDRTLLALGVVAALVLLVAWYGGDALLLRRVRALTAAAARFRAGDLSTPTGLPHRGDEIGQLAQAIDEMATSVYVHNVEFAHALDSLHESNEMLERVFENTHIHIAYLDHDFNFIRVNKTYADACRHPPEFFPGKNHFALYPDAENESIFRRVVETGEPFTIYAKPFEFPDQPERGVTWWDWTVSPVRAADGQVAALVFALVDVTERVRAEQRAGYLHLHDELTGLPNRTLLLDRLQQTLLDAERRGREAAVLCVDLDRFKYVNETLGHAAGDALLKEAAARLGSCVRAGDTVARLAGDQFVVVLADMATAADVGRIVQKIMACGATAFAYQGREHFLSTSLGVALYPLDGTDPGALLKNAELALHQAKERGGNDWRFYSAHMADKTADKVALSNELRLALKRDEFVLHYQPQVDIASGRIVGAEALIRWLHPQRGLVPPTIFIPLAEESGLIGPLGEWVLRRSCDQMRAWDAAGLPPISVAVNVSAQQFRYGSLAEAVGRALHDCTLPAGRLEIEITESSLMSGDDMPRGVLQQIADMGVSIAIDDFGTGYSALSYLQQLPIDNVKIDRSFVHGMAAREGGALVNAIIAMAHALGRKVVAEGVERDSQLGWLRAYGCDLAQGFYFSQPLPADEFARLLRARYANCPGKDYVN